MSNENYKIVSTLLLTKEWNDRTAGAVFGGLAGAGMAGVSFALPVGLVNALIKLGKELPPKDQAKLKFAVDQYIKQNNLNPEKDKMLIYQFSKDYSNKLGRARFIRRTAAGAAGTMGVGGAIGGATGATMGWTGLVGS